MRGIRARLTVTLVALVALTAVLLGAGAYLFVDNSLHDAGAPTTPRPRPASTCRCTIPRPRLPPTRPPSDIIDSGLRDTFLQRGVDTIIDVAGRRPVVSRRTSTGVLRRCRRISAPASTGASSPTPGSRSAGAEPGRRRARRGSGPAFYFVHDATALEDALGQLRMALIVGGVRPRSLVALVVARVVARGVLAPVEAAGRAAERIERGDLSARVPVTSDDEFGDVGGAVQPDGRRAGRHDRPARGRARPRTARFVADVAHELRTPLAALVAEASILREHLDALPADSRRAGELLVADVARLRTLVDDLMEVSRFDAGAEQVAIEPVDLGRLVRSVAAARLPEAVARSARPTASSSKPTRAGSSGSSATSSTTPASMPPGAASRSRCRAEARMRSRSRSSPTAGPACPPDRLDRIFERFYKADPSRHGGSSGLGLAIAAEHAALLGGDADRREPREAAACGSSSGCL